MVGIKNDPPLGIYMIVKNHDFENAVTLELNDGQFQILDTTCIKDRNIAIPNFREKNYKIKKL